MSSQPSCAAMLKTLVDKIVHPLEEIRGRAVQSIHFKLTHKLLEVELLAEDKELLKNLLDCCLLQNSQDLDGTLLSTLQQLAGPISGTHILLSLGAQQTLQQFKKKCPHLCNQADNLLSTLLNPNMVPLGNPTNPPVSYPSALVTTSSARASSSSGSGQLGVNSSSSSLQRSGSFSRLDHTALPGRHVNHPNSAVGGGRTTHDQLLASGQSDFREAARGVLGQVPDDAFQDIFSSAAAQRLHDLPSRMAQIATSSSHQLQDSPANPSTPILSHPAYTSTVHSTSQPSSLSYTLPPGVSDPPPISHSHTTAQVGWRSGHEGSTSRPTLKDPTSRLLSQQSDSASSSSSPRVLGATFHTVSSTTGRAVSSTAGGMLLDRKNSSLATATNTTFTTQTGRNEDVMRFQTSLNRQLYAAEGRESKAGEGSMTIGAWRSADSSKPGSAAQSRSGFVGERKKGAETVHSASSVFPGGNGGLDCSARVAGMAQTSAVQLPSWMTGVLGNLDGTSFTVASWQLRHVHMGPADEQHLFELCSRLSCDDVPRVVLPALRELRQGAVQDLPPEAILQHDGVMEKVLHLVSSTQGDMDVVSDILQLLLLLTQRLKKSITTATDPSWLMLPDSPYSAQTQTLSSTHTSARSGTIGGRSLQLTNELRGEYLSESLLLSSYPQPPVSAPEGCQSVAAVKPAKAEEVLHVTAAAHVIMLVLLPRLSDPSHHFWLVPVLEELFPIAVPLDPERDSDAAHSPQVCERLSQLLSMVTPALQACMSRARAQQLSAAMEHSGVRQGKPHSGLADMMVIDPASNHVLAFIGRVLKHIPSGESRSMVPAALADTLEAFLADEWIGAALPGLTSLVQHHLEAMHPCLMHIRALIEPMCDAIAAAEKVISQVPLLDAGRISAHDYLQFLQSATPVLDCPGLHQPVLAAAVQGLAIAAARNDDAHEDASKMLLGLLTHPGPQVGSLTFSFLSTLLQEAYSSPSPNQTLVAGAINLICDPDVVEYLITHGLEDDGSCQAATNMLRVVVQQAKKEHLQVLLRWEPWLRCYEQHAVAGPLACSLIHAYEQQMQSILDTHTSAIHQHSAVNLDQQYSTALIGLVRQMFSSVKENRQAASQKLLAAVMGRSSEHLLDTCDGDPLRGLLHRTGSDDPGRHNPPAVSTDGFTAADVEKLLGVLTHSDLTMELQRSAAEQLLVLAADAELMTVMEQQEVMEKLLSMGAPDGVDVLVQQELCLGPRRGAGERGFQAGSASCLQLQVSVLSLLAALASHSAVAREWILHDRGSRYLVNSIPLLFHPLTTVQRAAARLLAALAFIPAAELSSSFQAASLPDTAPSAAGIAASRAVVLPSLFQATYRLPFPVQWTVLQCTAPRDLRWDRILSGLNEADQGQLCLLVDQRRVLKAANGKVERLEEVLDIWQPGLPAVPSSILHHRLLPLRLLDPIPTIHGALQQMANATCHAHCHEALGSLLLVASTAEGAACVAGQEWAPQLQRYLCASPSSEDDKRLWAVVLTLLQRMLISKALPQAHLAFLATCFGQSTLQLLNTPKACFPPLRIPLSLLDQPALMSDTGSMDLSLLCSQLLNTLSLIIRRAHHSLPHDKFAQLLLSLNTASLLEAVAIRFLEQEGCSAGCKLAAMQLVEAVAAACGDLGAMVTENQDANVTILDVLEEGLQLLVCTLVTHVFAPSASHKAQGAKGQASMHAAMRSLMHIARALPPQAWAPAWQASGGALWLSRLLRHRLAESRCLAFGLAATLLTPGAHATQHMMQRSWPDFLQLAMKAAVDQYECWEVKAAAMRALGTLCCLDLHNTERQEAEDDIDADSDALESGSSFVGMQEWLHDKAFWQQFQLLLHWTPDPSSIPLKYLHAAVVLLLQAAQLDLSHLHRVCAPEPVQKTILRLLLPSHFLSPSSREQVLSATLELHSTLAAVAPVAPNRQGCSPTDHSNQSGCHSTSTTLTNSPAALVFSTAHNAARLVSILINSPPPKQLSQSNKIDTKPSHQFHGSTIPETSTAVSLMRVNSHDVVAKILGMWGKAVHLLPKLQGVPLDSGLCSVSERAEHKKCVQHLAAVLCHLLVGMSPAEWVPVCARVQAEHDLHVMVCAVDALKSSYLPASARMTIVSLISVLTASAEACAGVLQDEQGQEVVAHTFSIPVGAAAALALLSLLPDTTLRLDTPKLLPSDPTKALNLLNALQGSGSNTPRTASNELLLSAVQEACVLSTLRNLLTHSPSAKAALLNASLHLTLAHTVKAGCILLRQANQKSSSKTAANGMTGDNTRSLSSSVSRLKRLRMAPRKPGCIGTTPAAGNDVKYASSSSSNATSIIDVDSTELAGGGAGRLSQQGGGKRGRGSGGGDDMHGDDMGSQGQDSGRSASTGQLFGKGRADMSLRAGRTRAKTPTPLRDMRVKGNKTDKSNEVARLPNCFSTKTGEGEQDANKPGCSVGAVMSENAARGTVSSTITSYNGSPAEQQGDTTSDGGDRTVAHHDVEQSSLGEEVVEDNNINKSVLNHDSPSQQVNTTGITPGVGREGETALIALGSSDWISSQRSVSNEVISRWTAQQQAPVFGASADSTNDTTSSQAVTTKMLLCFNLLRHLAFGSDVTKEQLVAEGVMPLVGQAWPLVSAGSPLHQELLSLMVNMVLRCQSACKAIGETLVQSCHSRKPQGSAPPNSSASEPKSLVMKAVDVVVKGNLDWPGWRLAVSVLVNMASQVEGCAVLCEADVLLPFLSCLQASRDSREWTRPQGVLQVLLNMAAHPTGQRLLLKSSQSSALLSCVLWLLDRSCRDVQLPGAHQPPPATRLACLKLIHNLSFSPDLKPHFTSNPISLEAVVAVACELGPMDAQVLAYASTALWALFHHGEKVKALVRQMAGRPEQLEALRLQCETQLKVLAAQSGVTGNDKEDDMCLDASQSNNDGQHRLLSQAWYSLDTLVRLLQTPHC